MFYLSSPLISLGVQCFHLSLSNKEGVCSSFAFVTAASFPVADGSSVCASIPGTARNEQRCDMQELCQCLSLPLLELFQQRLCIEVIFERREKWHPVMTQCKGSRGLVPGSERHLLQRETVSKWQIFARKTEREKIGNATFAK